MDLETCDLYIEEQTSVLQKMEKYSFSIDFSRLFIEGKNAFISQGI